MATLLLGALGASLGGSLFGGVLGAGLGASLGRAAGAIAGNIIDQQLFGTKRHIEGPRLDTLDVQASSEGAPIPRVYGRARIAGQVIWAAPFEEVATTKKQGGKGGPRVTTTTYSYYASFAVGLCEGPVAGLSRVYADGVLIDQDAVEMRLYHGSETQDADPLIAGHEGTAPAYRGLCYVVFERLPLADYGNRLPQLTFEILRPLGELEEKLEAVTLIPGAGEFAYHTNIVRRIEGAGRTRAENAVTGLGRADVLVALDELQMLCPNLKAVSIVSTWFGSDLRADHCRIEPRVEVAAKTTSGATWSVGGLMRASAVTVSTLEGRPAFGGTPSDSSLLALIAELKARGIKVWLHPFIMMDVPPGNALADPWAGASIQPAYPWRGRFTSDPAPGEAGTPDATAAIDAALSTFIGTAMPGDFTVASGAVSYQGPAEWSFRRFILHHAKLALAAGGVDGFLLGSEMRGLTRLNDGSRRHPFVDALKVLAGEVRVLLGPDATITYGADWSEYANHRPDDGSGDVTFHLDALWSDPAVSAVGINWYQPMSDWRGGEENPDAAEGAGLHERATLLAGIAGGENADWYYASEADRVARLRTPIADSAYGKDFVFASKDLSGWWSNAHVDRIGGVETGSPTGWQPGMKPVVFTEIGIAAVDLATNAPNLFPDPKSSEDALPPFSRGGRDDALQRRALEAHLSHWSGEGPSNPVIGLTQMLDGERLFLWAWDARPFPWFPLAGDVWADGANWTAGHWLNGRLGQVPLDRLVGAICADQGVGEILCEGLDGVVDGYVVDRPMSARAALEPLAALAGFSVRESAGALVFHARGRGLAAPVDTDALVPGTSETLIERTRTETAALHSEVTIGHRDPLREHRPAIARSRRLGEGDGTTRHLDVPAILDASGARSAADRLLHDGWAGRETVRLALPPSARAFEPGDLLLLDGDAHEILRIEDGEARRIGARRIDRRLLELAGVDAPLAAGLSGADVVGPADLLALDLPRLPGDDSDILLRIAAYADPFRAPLTLYQSTGTEDFTPLEALFEPALRGTLVDDLAAGTGDLLETGATVDVTLLGGELESVGFEALLSGANALAIGTEEGGFEVIQFQTAALVGPDLYRLSGLLRGQLGTADLMKLGHASGADVVLLDGRVAGLSPSGVFPGTVRNLRALWPGAALDGSSVAARSVTFGARAVTPLAPVHARLKRGADGTLRLSFIRQSRFPAPVFSGEEPLLGEEREAYRIEILDAGAVVRTADTDAPLYDYTLAAQTADFGAPVLALDLRIRQIGSGARSGLFLERSLSVCATFSTGSA
ncbi:MAG: glycoside hydrolase/phage tail family protein [Hyphomicrobiaceae bacterium]|nr:glycoside hydrolase/phage tail family protein [Hyphomicrobiaceae bacterium]